MNTQLITTVALGGFKFLSGLGVGTIVDTACKSFIPEELSTVKRVGCFLGTFALSQTVGYKVDEVIDKKYESTKATISKVKNWINNEEKKESDDIVITEVQLTEESPIMKHEEKKKTKKKETKKTKSKPKEVEEPEAPSMDIGEDEA